MGGGIVRRFHPIAGAGQHGPIRPQYDRADRHFAPRGGIPSLLKGYFHRFHAVLLAPMHSGGLASAA